MLNSQSTHFSQGSVMRMGEKSFKVVLKKYDMNTHSWSAVNGELAARISATLNCKIATGNNQKEYYFNY